LAEKATTFNTKLATFIYFCAMLRFTGIRLTQFKNYETAGFNFHGRIVGICGLNGCGKTNLLDALYYSCFTKSYFSKSDALTAQFGSTGFRLEANLHDGADTPCALVCVYRGQAKKEFSVNGVEYDKFSAHIGRLPAVMVAPDDIELVTGSSSERRRYMDMILSQTDQAYLQHLITYNKILLQRNSLLKRFAETGQTDMPLLEVIDSQLAHAGTYIYSQRAALCANLLPLIQQLYRSIAAGSSEEITLYYESQLNDTNFSSLLNSCRQKDFLLQRSNGGIHKDDISTELAGQEFKSTASQGQRKSLLFALKLAEFEFLKTSKGFAPVLLLDDIFEKLDEARMKNLLHRVCVQNNGQVFITDTHAQRLDQALKGIDVQYQMIHV
jgi:DNA replication and repair protein RecF